MGVSMEDGTGVGIAHRIRTEMRWNLMSEERWDEMSVGMWDGI